MTGAAWRFVTLPSIYAIHDRQLSEHGGADGLRDRSAVESALARAVNLAAYGEPDTADLAAAYAFGPSWNHGFVDGNKRTAWVAARLFLADNGHRLKFEPADAVALMEEIAAGNHSENKIAEWFRSRME